MSADRPVILFGHSGFLGRRLMSHMVDVGDRVHGYSSAEIDLRRPEALASLHDDALASSTVIIAAALTPDRGADIPQFMEHVALLGNLARRLGQVRAAKIVYISTDGVCASTDDLISEDCQIACDDLYTLAKYAGERLFVYAARRSGSNLLIVRPVALFGPGDPHNSYGPNRFTRSIAERRTIELFGMGEELRDHLYVEDAATAIRELSLSEATGVVHIASGEIRSFGSIAQELSEMCPFPVTITRLPTSKPVRHRRMSVVNLRSRLPAFRTTPFRAALRTTLESALFVTKSDHTDT